MKHERVLYIFLDVVCYNASAISFYEKLGFVRVRVKKNHYEIEGALYDAYVLVWYKDETKRQQMRKSSSPPPSSTVPSMIKKVLN
jgi:RimJ/RimL family protein N-acetyltransferase